MYGGLGMCPCHLYTESTDTDTSLLAKLENRQTKPWSRDSPMYSLYLHVCTVYNSAVSVHDQLRA